MGRGRKGFCRSWCSVWSSTVGQHLRNGISLPALLGRVGAAQNWCHPIPPTLRAWGLQQRRPQCRAPWCFWVRKATKSLKNESLFVKKKLFSPSVFIIRQVPCAPVQACNIFYFILGHFCVYLNVRIGADRDKSPVNSFTNYQKL